VPYVPTPVGSGFRRRRHLALTARAAAIGLAALVVWACGSTTPSPPPIASPTPVSTVLAATATPSASATESPSASPSASPGLSSSPAPGGSLAAIEAGGVIPPRPGVNVSIVAAGDIACAPTQNVGAPTDCDQAGTAALIGRLRPRAVLALGDLQYENGSLAGFDTVFGPTWGRYKSILFPAIGNHEYLTAGAAGYFTYFGHIAPYYSYNLGDWHVISLDSECHFVGGCQAGSAQETWLRADLAAHPTFCTLVYWHEPRWSSGEHGDATQMATIWSDLVAAQVDVVLSGHNHDYERFAPLNAAGAPSAAGVTEFVVGTGGKNHYAFTRPPLAGELVRNDTAFGVLRMVLGPTSFSWRFYAAPGYSFGDSGAARCH
jgi:hypothetical protein